MPRLNSRRRLIQKIKQWDIQAHEETVAYNDEPLQKGQVRSALSPRVQLTAYAVPRDGWDYEARKGKVVKGKFVPSRGTKTRFGVKS